MNKNCIVDLVHVGEVLVAELLRNDADNVCQILQMEKLTDQYKVFSELNVTCGDKTFDGMSRIDICIIYQNVCYPIELKLGKTLMNDNLRGIGRFTDGYGFSHNDSRVCGSMISILDNKPLHCKKIIDRTHFRVKNSIPVFERWTLIVRDKNIAENLNRKKGFFRSKIKNCNEVLAFEQLFKKEVVNSTLKKLLPDEDFYGSWIK